MKNIFLLLLFSIAFSAYSQQQPKKLKIINAGQTYPHKEDQDVQIFIDPVVVEINGATIRCKRAEINSKINYLKAMGNVIMNQGDTVFQTSDFADYDGNIKLVTSWGNVVLKDPTMTLTSEKIKFDRARQHLYYNNYGTIKDSINVLKSKEGNYFLESTKFQAYNNVTVVNPDQTLVTDHLEYFTDTGKAYLYKPSTITSEESVIYTEKGFHDSKNKISHLTKNSWIQYDDRLIEGDSLFHNELQNFSTATGNIRITDTINNSILKGGYGEFYRNNDSAFVVKRAVAITLQEKDSIYIHGDTLLVTGKPALRVVRAFHHVKFFKEDLRGKCDSLVSIQSSGLTKMFRKPVLWSQESQITGDIIHFLTNKETEQMDSLKVLSNAFMIQKDSAGYNQTKGRVILGKFENNDLKNIDVNGNAEVVQFVRNGEDELIGITKNKSSSIHITMKDKQMITAEFIGASSGRTYPEEDLRERDRILRGFIWRESEKPVTKKDIFYHNPADDLIIQQERAKEREENIRKRKSAEKKRLRRLVAKALRKKQDSIDALIDTKLPIKQDSINVLIDKKLPIKQDSIDVLIDTKLRIKHDSIDVLNDTKLPIKQDSIDVLNNMKLPIKPVFTEPILDN
jgi:lipopolysaccharide export system protein LptA|tara:strand:- start:48764 stop:50638 length:1875 start_codon:yes stop_codon:yes gene_type:complete